MEVNPSHTTESLSFPLPMYSSVCIGEATSKEGIRFFIFAGLNAELAAELKTLSLDPNDTALQDNTSDRERFGIGSYETWYAKDRTPFALVDAETNSLAALTWFGPKPLGEKPQKSPPPKSVGKSTEHLKENWHTISYRCYPRFRGKGLMKGFVGFVMDMYMKNFPKIKLWAGVKPENMASAGALALSLGFQLSEKASDKNAGWLVMVKE